MNRVRLAIHHGPGLPFELRTLEKPRLAEGELLVEISLATVCGSDLHTLDGRRSAPAPCVLGHEAVGRVVDLSHGVDPSLLGQRVTWSIASSCGSCQPCRHWALPQKCEQLFKYGHAALDDGSGLNGCYASHSVLRPGTFVLPIPDSLPDSVVAPVNCALATMVAALEPFSIAGHLAVIQGAGLLGLYGCALLKQAGWDRVVVVDKNPGRLELVPRFGGEPAHISARSIADSSSADLVMELTGSPAVIKEGVDLLRPGGHYALVGMVHPDSLLNLTGETIIRKCLTLRGTHNYAPKHLLAAARFLESQQRAFPWEQLVAPALPLESIDDVISLAKSGAWTRAAIRP